MCRPCSRRSSPVLPITTRSSAGWTRTTPRSIRAAPIPPAGATSTRPPPDQVRSGPAGRERAASPRRGGQLPGIGRSSSSTTPDVLVPPAVEEVGATVVDVVVVLCGGAGGGGGGGAPAPPVLWGAPR